MIIGIKYDIVFPVPVSEHTIISFFLFDKFIIMFWIGDKYSNFKREIFLNNLFDKDVISENSFNWGISSISFLIFLTWDMKVILYFLLIIFERFTIIFFWII